MHIDSERESERKSERKNEREYIELVRNELVGVRAIHYFLLSLCDG